MSTSMHQQAAIHRLEELFRDVKLEHDHQTICPDLRMERKIIDQCCDIHGKHAKENCTNRRGSLNIIYSRKDSLNSRNRNDNINLSSNTLGRRSSLGLSSSIASTIKHEVHPSSFPNTLRRDPLAASTGAINHYRRDSYNNVHQLSKRDTIGRSMGCLKKDNNISSTINYNAPLRRDYVAKSMTNLQRVPVSSTIRRDSLESNNRNITNLFGTSPNSLGTLKSGNININNNFNDRSVSNGNLKSCLAGSNGNSRNNLSVTLKSDPLHGSNGNLRKDKLGMSYGNFYNTSLRKGSFDRRRFSTDSLDNFKRNSWDPGRRDSSGSSGGWDDPIWEEGSEKVKYK